MDSFSDQNFDIYYIYYFQPKKRKNVSHDDLGNKLGRIHMKTQDFTQLQARKVKGLKKKSKKGKKETVTSGEEVPPVKKARVEEVMDET